MKVHYHIHKSPVLVPTLRQTNAVHAIQISYFKNPFRKETPKSKPSK